MTTPLTPIDPVLCATIDGWFPPPNGLDEIKTVYGDIAVANGIIVSPSRWEDSNMMVARADWLPLGKIYVNARVWPIFKSAFEACLALGDGYEIKTLGCFCPRPKRVNGDLSVHSWGAAMDLNASDNPLQEIGGPVICDIPDAWIACFESRGLCWGGRFSGRKDPMHFQAAVNY